MAKNIEKLTNDVIEQVGGVENIGNCAYCMTRLRLTIKDPSNIDDEKIKQIDGVMGLVHDKADYYEVVVGPGTSKKCADFVKSMMLKDDQAQEEGDNLDWQKNKQAIKGKQKGGRVKAFLKVLGEIFVPLIPGVMTAGLCAGFATLIEQVYPDFESNVFIHLLYHILLLIKVSFMTYITAWAGYRATERFGGTPILGGMVGMITSLSSLTEIGEILGNENLSFLGNLIKPGYGGVIAALIGAWCVAKVEKFIHDHMYGNIDIVVTPLLSIIIVVIPYIFVIMPIAGLCSDGIAWVVEQATLNESVIVRIITGYICAALFLPLVAMGMHHSLIAIYAVQLNNIGYITLYPALCMAGFGQIGAAIAIYIVAKRVKNYRLPRVISGSILAGILGVGEPMIYGVTLPLGKPFFTAGLGAGFGGAIVMAFQCASTSWGPSGLLGVFVVTAGPLGAAWSILIYLIGGIVSVICGFIISMLFIRPKDVAEFK